MSDSEQAINPNADISVSATAQITLISVVLIVFFILLILLFYFRSQSYVGTSAASSTSRRLIFAPPPPSALSRALDASILDSLPVTIFRSEVYRENDGLECAVCLCELSDGEKVRFLPKCRHGFHVDCIDMWFHSNDACPLCRTLVTETSLELMVVVEIQPLEAVCEDRHSVNESNEGSSSYNVGSSTSTSTSTSTSCTSTNTSSSIKRKEGMLVIDIPRGAREGFSSSTGPLSSSRIPSDSPLPTSRLLEEIKSPGLGRMKSFRRMLSSVSSKGVGSSRTPRGCDTEEAGEVVDPKRQ